MMMMKIIIRPNVIPWPNGTNVYKYSLTPGDLLA